MYLQISIISSLFSDIKPLYLVYQASVAFSFHDVSSRTSSAYKRRSTSWLNPRLIVVPNISQSIAPFCTSHAFMPPKRKISYVSDVSRNEKGVKIGNNVQSIKR